MRPVHLCAVGVGVCCMGLAPRVDSSGAECGVRRLLRQCRVKIVLKLEPKEAQKVEARREIQFYGTVYRDQEQGQSPREHGSLYTSKKPYCVYVVRA